VRRASGSKLVDEGFVEIPGGLKSDRRRSGDDLASNALRGE